MSLDGKYMVIAQIAADNAPKGWLKIEFHAIIGDGYVKSKYYAFLESGEKKSYIIENIVDDDKVVNSVIDIREIMRVPGQDVWTKCKFTLFPDGNFKFDVEYDD